ncbi:DUF5060 domain-containing protein [uncultured Lutibacter sp.]|uniref:DUF5060 domain-containing protein n=1 Tax=uncultured Lutibacter sp. TaxID=437739 RepID=UPI00262ED1EE|nr:DUF5060 domain-containing protein [uncultured Lutibacter sp.]
MQLRIVLLVTFLLISINSIGQKKEVIYNRKSVQLEKYQVVDVSFFAKKIVKQPFEVDFGAIFTKPNGEKLKVLGFYNDAKEWLLRFSANEIGEWTYITFSSLKELDNKKGKFNISTSEVTKHGAVVIDKNNPKKFAYEDGTPYFLQAFEIDWLFALDYDNDSAIPKTEHLLSLIKENGFNQVVTTLYSYDVRWEKDEKLKLHPEHEFGSREDIFPFLGSNSKPDHSSLNVAFFKKFDRVISSMHNEDIVANLMIYVWNKKVKWPKAGSPEDDRFFDYVLKRYQAFPNVVWNISKEAFRQSIPYMSERIERAKKLDAFNRLVTIHDFRKAEDAPIDFISYQGGWSTLYTKMIAEYTKHNKPVVNIENAGYSESSYMVFPCDFIISEECLKRNYQCYFAGVYTNYYWQALAWNVMVYNPYEQDEDFIKPNFEYYKYLENFFTIYNYQDFYPVWDERKIGHCLKSDTGVYLYYMEKENYQLSIYSNKGVGLPQGTYRWFNTFTGEFSEEIEYKGKHIVNPFHRVADAILVRNTNN